MKKLIAGLVLWGALVSSSYAFDRFGNFRNEIPRSSVTVSQDAYILISSGGIVLRDVIVTSATAGSNIQFWNSTSPISLGNYRFGLITDTLGSRGPFDMYYSSGLAYQKFGNAAIIIKWDFVMPADRTASFTRPNYPE